MFNNKAILILKTNEIYTKHLKSKILLKFSELHICNLDEYKNYTYNQILKKINEIINNKNIDTAFFEGDYVSLISYNFISKLNIRTKILLCFDDFDMHEMNSITAKACDNILTSCPISDLKFKEKNLISFFCPLEADQNLYKKIDVTKKYDVLFFGTKKYLRDNFINEIKKNKINLKLVGYNNDMVNESELIKLINESKIVINFSNTGFSKKFTILNSFNFDYLQLKGRLIISGLCGTPCISQYSPANKLLFNENEIWEFKNSSQMIELIKVLLNDKNIYEKYANKYCEKAKQHSDQNLFISFYKSLGQESSKEKITKLPYWYENEINKRKVKFFRKNNNIMTFLLNTFEDIIFKTKKLNLNNIFLIIKNLLLMPFIILNIIYNSNKKN